MSRNLKPKQLLAAQMLAEGDSCEYAALKVDVAPETISRWKKTADFNQEIEDLMAHALRVKLSARKFLL